MNARVADQIYEARLNAYTMERQNGRVDTVGAPPPRAAFELYSETTNPNKDFEKRAVSAFLSDESPSQRIFLGENNINRLQNQIISQVKAQSGYSIARQSDRELQIIMRSIYLQFGRNPQEPERIVDEIKKLNNKVLEYSVPKIITNIKQYLQYKNDASSMPVQMERPRNVSNKGTKSLMYNVF